MRVTLPAAAVHSDDAFTDRRNSQLGERILTRLGRIRRQWV
jgi:hypothetical protein